MKTQIVIITKILFTVLVAALASGCGKDSVADFVSRQKDREVATAQAQMKESEGINGTYVGEAHTSDPDSPDYDVTADIETMLVNRDDTYIPQPKIRGGFTLISRNLKDTDGSALETPFPIADGSYTSALATVSVTINSPDHNPAIRVVCKVLNRDHLSCRWRGEVGRIKPFEFTLTRK